MLTRELFVELVSELYKSSSPEDVHAVLNHDAVQRHLIEQQAELIKS